MSTARTMIEHDPSMAEYTEYGRVHQSPLIFTEYTEYGRVHRSPLHRFCPASALQLHTESTCFRTIFAPNSHSDRLRTDLAPISHRSRTDSKYWKSYRIIRSTPSKSIEVRPQKVPIPGRGYRVPSNITFAHIRTLITSNR